MGLNCSSTMIKYLLFFFNLLFVITGVIIIAVGVSVKAQYHEFGEFLNSKFIYVSDLLIVIGVIIFIVAFFGCCGAIRESACMTLTFSGLLIAIFILELIVGVGGYLLRNRTDQYINQTLLASLDEYDVQNATEVTRLWDVMQGRFQCCGVNGPIDWKNDTNSTNGYLPLSCCNIPTGKVNNLTCSMDSGKDILHTEGCLTAFGEYIKGHAATVEAVGLTLAVAQLLGIIYSCYLSRQIRRDYETV